MKSFVFQTGNRVDYRGNTQDKPRERNARLAAGERTITRRLAEKVMIHQLRGAVLRVVRVVSIVCTVIYLYVYIRGLVCTRPRGFRGVMKRHWKTAAR